VDAAGLGGRVEELARGAGLAWVLGLVESFAKPGDAGFDGGAAGLLLSPHQAVDEALAGLVHGAEPELTGLLVLAQSLAAGGRHPVGFGRPGWGRFRAAS
jgi:hypothetical protein